MTTPAESPAPSLTRRILPVCLIYFAVVLLHVVVLNGVYRFPFFCTDTAQYVPTAQNILNGNGYTVRGAFNSTNPPLYPLFLALLMLPGSDPFARIFLAQCLLGALTVFFTFALAREIGLAERASLLLAAAAGCMPHTYFDAVLMTEALQYPLLMAIAYLAWRWFDRPTPGRALLLGLSLAVALLNKLATNVVLIPLLIASLQFSVTEVRRGASSWAAMAARLGALFGTVALVLGGWYGYKLAQGGGLLGYYGAVIHEEGINHGSLSLVISSCADFFLAAGLVTLLPVALFLRRLRRQRPACATFFGLLIVVQVAWVSIIDGGLTGLLRERLLSYTLPLVGVFAVAGIEEMKARLSFRARIYMFATPLLCLAAMGLAEQSLGSATDTPWMYAFGAFWPIFSPVYSGLGLALVAAALIALLMYLLLRLDVRNGVLLLSMFICGFHLFTFLRTARVMNLGARDSLDAISPLATWLRANGAGDGASLLVTAGPSPWERRRAPADTPDRMEPCSGGPALDQFTVWQMETYLRWDVRTTCSWSEIRGPLPPGRLVLSRQNLDAVSTLDRVAIIERWGWRLYRAKPGSQPAGLPPPR